MRFPPGYSQRRLRAIHGGGIHRGRHPELRQRWTSIPSADPVRGTPVARAQFPMRSYHWGCAVHWIRPREPEIGWCAAMRPRRRLRGDRIWWRVIDVDIARRQQRFPAASVAETAREWRPSGRSPMGSSHLTRLVRARPRLRAVAWVDSDRVRGPSDDVTSRTPALSSGYRRRWVADPPAHPLPARQRPVQRDRRWDRVVDCDLHYVGVDRCPGLALGRAADHQLVDPVVPSGAANGIGHPRLSKPVASQYWPTGSPKIGAPLG